MLNERSLDKWCALHGGLQYVRFISLPAETRRRQNFRQKVLPFFKTKCVMVDGISGKSLAVTNPQLEHVVDSMTWYNISKKRIRENHEGTYTLGAVGCALTHMRELEHASKARGCTLVLESDADIVRNRCAWSDIVSYLPQLPTSVDAVWFHATRRKNIKHPVPNTKNQLFSIQGPFFSMAAILYTPQGAKRLLHLIKKHDMLVHSQIDATFGALAARFPHDITLAALSKNLFRQRGLTSSVQTLSLKARMPSSNTFYVLGFVVVLMLFVMVVMLCVQCCLMRKRVELLQRSNNPWSAYHVIQ